MMMEANPPANTGTAEIPPMPFGFTLSRVYRILRDHLKVFLGIGVVPGVAMMALYGTLMSVLFAYLWPYLDKNGSPANNPDPFALMHVLFPAIVLAMIAFIIPVMAIMSFYLTAALHAANKIDSGTATTVRESYSVAWRDFGRSIVLLISFYLRAFGLAYALLIAAFGAFALLMPESQSQSPSIALFTVFPLLWFLYMGAYVYGVVAALRMCLAFPASIEEGLTPGDAIRRSNHLTYGSKGRIFLLLLIVELIGSAFFMVLYILGLLVFGIGSLGFSALPIHPGSPGLIVATVIAGIVFLCFFFAWYALLYGSLVITLSVVYHDQRRRKDAPILAQPPATGVELPPGAEPA
jgi:hypothetical protein